MSNKDKGGPAFPVHPDMAAQLGCVPSSSDAGMSLRDYFAAKAMNGFISAKAWHPDFIYPTDFNFDTGKRAADAVSVAAYKYADAMLKARKQ